MNIILIHENDHIDGTLTKARICGRRFDHISRVLNPSAGSQLKCGRIQGKVGPGTVSRISNDFIELDLDLKNDPPGKADIDIVLALPRPKSLRRIIQAAVSMGVTNIHLINSGRVEKSYWQSPFLERDHLKEQILLGLEQSGDTVLPSISLHRFFKPFAEDILPDLISRRSAILAHPYSDNPVPGDIPVPVTLAIGPEGGFLPYEVTMLEKGGFHPVSMGKRVLRTETAVIALISKFI